MRHHALLVSQQSNERVDVTLDVVDGHVEMFVAETSVGRWPITRFVGAPAEDGFRLVTDGDTWTVAPRDRPLFEADAIPRLNRRSRAYMANRYPRATRAIDVIRSGGLKGHLTRLVTVSGLGILSFGFGIIAGRFRLDGGNVSAWIFLALILGGSLLVTRLLSAPTQPIAETREPRDLAALDHLMSTLQFQEPTPLQERPALEAQEPAEPDDEPRIERAESPDEPPAMPTDHPPTEAADHEPPTGAEASPAMNAPADATVSADPSDNGSETPTAAHSPESPSPEEVPPDAPSQVTEGGTDVVRHRVERPAHPETAVDRGRIRLPGGRQQFPRVPAEGDPESAQPIFAFEIEPADDLTSIHGIGPTFAALLHDVGIRSFRQLASIDDATLSRLRDLMGPFAGRIERDGWIEGAARAHREQRERRVVPTG